MSKHICIVGGSGFVGRAIARVASERGYRVTIACRHPERARDLMVKGVRLVKADVVDGQGLEQAVHGADCVINLVGILFEKGRYSFEAVHLHGTDHLLAACERAHTRRYLHMSALGADTASPSTYARTKAEAEERVRQAGLNRGLGWTIFRPSVIYGAGDSFFNRFRQLSSLPFVLPVIGGNTRFQPVWIEDVARAFVACIGNRHTTGRSYELGGPKSYSLRELLAMFMQALGRRRLLLNVPQPIAEVMAALLRFLPTPPLTPDQLKLLQRDNVVDGEPFPAIFGTPAALEEVLPTLLSGSQATRLQQRLDRYRRYYWKIR